MHVCEPQTNPRIACSERYKRTCVHGAASVTSAGRSAMVGVRASRAWPLTAPFRTVVSGPGRPMRAVWHVHANQPGRDQAGLPAGPALRGVRPGRPASARCGLRRALGTGAAQAADDRAVLDLLGRELDAAWHGQARALDRRPPPAPLGGFARAIVA